MTALMFIACQRNRNIPGKLSAHMLYARVFRWGLLHVNGNFIVHNLAVQIQDAVHRIINPEPERV